MSYVLQVIGLVVLVVVGVAGLVIVSTILFSVAISFLRKKPAICARFVQEAWILGQLRWIARYAIREAVRNGYSGTSVAGLQLDAHDEYAFDQDYVYLLLLEERVKKLREKRGEKGEAVVLTAAKGK